MPKKPVHEVRIGFIKASVWKNHSRSGERHNVTVSRIYRNGDVWKESTHFGRDDLLPLAKVVDMVHSWIFENAKSTGE